MNSEKVVYRCETLEKFWALVEKFQFKNWEICFWDSYKEHTCISKIDSSYCSDKYWKERGYTILPYPLEINIDDYSLTF